VTRGLLDTNIFISRETRRPLDVASMPDEVSVSVITLAELQHGIYKAANLEQKKIRMATYQHAATLEALEITIEVANIWAGLRASTLGGKRQITENDLWIAATAISQGIPLVTQDRAFEGLQGLETILV
jgi:predicted nucleic acid-binding protein